MNHLIDKVLLVDKPEDWTSFDVVAKIRSSATRALKTRLQDDESFASRIDIDASKKLPRLRVGHSGTLDPSATGLLLIAVGSATKKIPGLLKQDKTYLVDMKLGVSSTTGDKEGELTEDSKYSNNRMANIESVIRSFIGEIEQIPPVYSAIKVDGKRAYELARAGRSPDMKPRKAHINSIGDIKVDLPHIRFRADVASGTYIRTLVEDIAKKLGTVGYMTGLRRESIGKERIENALTVDEAMGELDTIINRL